MSEPLCPNCNKPLSQAVVKGPPQAVVRCEGCQTLLLWSNGRVMRSAKSATPTIMGMPAVTGKAPPARDAEAPLPELKPEADALPAQPQSSFPKPPPRTPPPAGKTPPPRTATQPVARPPQPKQTVTGLGDNVPTRVAPPTPELRKEAAKKEPTPGPMKVAPSGPLKVPPSGPVKLPPAAPAAKPTPAPTAKPTPAPSAAAKPKAPESPQVVAAVAQVPQMGSSGDMVDPSAWFAGGDVSDVVPPEKLPPIEGLKPTRADSTGAQPLPPPPSLPPLEVEPFEIEAPGTEATPAMGTVVPEPQDVSERIAVREPSQKVATPPPAAKTPAPTKAVTDLPSARTSIGKPPEPAPRSTVFGRPALDLPLAKEPPKAEPPKPAPKIEAPKIEAPRAELPKFEPPKPAPPKLEPPKPAEAVAAAVSMLPSEATPPPKMTPAPNAPAAVVEREISAEALPPPPSSMETTTETLMPARLPETTRVPRELPRRTILIAGGAAAGVLVLVLIVVGLSHGSKAPSQPAPRSTVVATPRPTAPQATAPQATAPQPSARATAPVPTPPPAKTPPPVVATPEPPSEEPPVAPAPAPTRPRRTLGGKKVVLEYDPKPTSPAPPPPQAPTPMGEDPATVARAREAYHRGNVKLFAGDDKGAIDLYRESLKIYPGYVAGYRGLGLAYEEAGEKNDALKAFHTYVRTVPNAVDAAIIRRRIDHLEGNKSP